MSDMMSYRGFPRMDFGRVKVDFKIPDLIGVQRDSYDRKFLQLDLAAGSARKKQGLESVLSNIFPIFDNIGSASLEYITYRFDSPKYDIEECTHRGLTFSAPLKVNLQLVVWDIDEDSGTKNIKGIKEQEVYMGDIPLMTDNGTFVINGVERVVVSQMHRSPGVFFDHDKGKTHASGKFLYSVRVIPYRGSWLDIEFDGRDYIYFRIDKKRKLHISSLLYALGMSRQEILDYYYQKSEYYIKDGQFETDFLPLQVSSHKLTEDLINAETGEVVLKSGQKLTPRLSTKLKEQGLSRMFVSQNSLIGEFVSDTIIDEKTGEVIVECGEEISDSILTKFIEAKIKQFSILLINADCGPYIRNTMFLDKNLDQESALNDIFRLLRPGEPPTYEAAKKLFDNLFSKESRYDLSEVGRLKINTRLNRDEPLDNYHLMPDDIKKMIKVLVRLKDGKGTIDDIDHLGNRRVRSVGELIENQFMIGFIRLQKSIQERMNMVTPDAIMPNDLINPKLIVAVIKEFFGTSQLSQFMDQTNPLSEVTHKRRLSALGPGGLNRERAGAEVRDVHVTHYGKICPIETPEGQNIGLINSLATFARVNKYGFIESPYRKVKDGQITDQIEYLSAIEEGKYKIAPVVNFNNQNQIEGDLVNARVGGDFIMTKPSNIDYVGVVPMQLVSVASAMIPFLENNDANRALMGANMQRQAVPLLQNQAPLVGTGIEAVVARDSGAAIISKYDGIVRIVDSSRIVIKTMDNKPDSPDVEIYNLIKFRKSNHNTCINQTPLVDVGDKVKVGQVITDGPCIDRGEIAIGKNVLVAFIPWRGYNFKDSIVISEKLVQDDVFTSIHIESFEIVARDTRLGPEEITRDIPNVSDENVSYLDEVGIVNIGASVKSGDILVGKVTPKTESPLTSEEKLLRAIFGEKASDVRDSSFRVPPGVRGTVVEVKVFSRRGVEKDERMLSIERHQVEKLTKDKNDKLSIIIHFVKQRLFELLQSHKLVSGPQAVKVGTVLSHDVISKLSINLLLSILTENEGINTQISLIREIFEQQQTEIESKYSNKVSKIHSGDDLPQGALKVVKVFIATKHKLQAGDKMAGRHGNKGIVSKILSIADMPFLEDGRIVDILLNPLGIPSRMNVGQILETHLGWASHNLGLKIGEMIDKYHHTKESLPELIEFIKKIYGTEHYFIQELESLEEAEQLDILSGMRDGVYFASAVFDGAKVKDIKNMLELSGVDPSGQVRMIDGRTGEYFDRKITVGYKYMLKLHHLVDEKIHARSIGPYSLVTQQPLGGKSHFGGQRVGEMECWALQAYGAAYVLQEMLTVKSDDVIGRIKIFESIIRGENNFEYGVPESLNVMLKEFSSLGLHVQLMK